MLHWLYMYVAGVCFKCLLQIFYLDVVYVTVPIHMLQVYVVDVSSISDVCCKKCFYVASVSLADAARECEQR
jgi:hypothetical protein